MSDRDIRIVAVIGGGANDEHDVSLESAAAVTRAIQALGLGVVPVTIDLSGGWNDAAGTALSPVEAMGVLAACDLVFPVLHGVDGEDGAIAGLLTMSGIPFVGSPVRAGALGMDKWVTKLVAEAVGIATAPGVLVREWFDAESIGLELPFVVKPTTGGSSNGVSVAHDVTELRAAIDHARSAGGHVLIEEFVTGREVDIALFREADGTLRAGATLEIGVAEGGVFDRETKYDGTASFIVPARVTAREHAVIEESARALYVELGCAGVARFDFFVTTAGVVLNEVNTSPGLTEQSQVPRMFAATGLDYVDLVAALVAAAR